jgi:hypothetical protein
MSESVLFIVGAIVFAITVYGVVMAGGLLLTRSEIDQNDDRGPGPDHAEVQAGLPLNVKY